MLLTKRHVFVRPSPCQQCALPEGTTSRSIPPPPPAGIGAHLAPLQPRALRPPLITRHTQEPRRQQKNRAGRFPVEPQLMIDRILPHLNTGKGGV